MVKVPVSVARHHFSTGTSQGIVQIVEPFWEEVPKAKKAKLHSPACVKILEQNGFGIFSVKTHNKDLRCLVIVDQGQVHCTAEKCMEVRSYVNSTE